MRRIRRANDLIPDPELSAQIDSIENSCGQILSILEQRPQLLSQLRTFLRYYLPTTLRLLEARAKLENSADTPKAREVRSRISIAVGRNRQSIPQTGRSPGRVPLHRPGKRDGRSARHAQIRRTD